mmetsp:Transcript_27192/g.27707  ORF Transcript_27192/g.27707 Transcript_27192/m.27707 type:complete len:473 (-) Transcript_27192:189-1607(-)
MEPTLEEAAEGSILVKVLATVLERLVNSNTSIARSDPGQVTKFHALKAPGIGVEAYLERVQKYASCSNECFILALIYIDRLIERNNFLLTELNVHRVVITAILLAAKFFDDAYYNNAYYAKVGGVLVSELNGLEVDFLFRINFSLHVSPDVFEKYKAELVAHSINSGLIATHLSSLVPSQLPHIQEMESGSANSNSSTSSMRMMTTPELAQLQQIQQQFHFPIDRMHINNGAQTVTSISNQVPETTLFRHDSAMATAPKQVTPSPSLSSRDIVDMVSGNIGVGSIIPYSSSNKHTIVQAQPQHMDQSNRKTTSVISAPFQPLHVSTSSSSKIYSNQQQHQHQSIILQRANSLPYISSGRCIDHTFKLPYSVPLMPATVPNAFAAVDHERYQLMMNQLFPIENTLVHHNHEVRRTTATSDISDHQHHVNAVAAGLVEHHHHHHAAGASHHSGIQGTGLGPMAYQQVSWSGEIR